MKMETLGIEHAPIAVIFMRKLVNTLQIDSTTAKFVVEINSNNMKDKGWVMVALILELQTGFHKLIMRNKH
jgi:hypothetical protein